MTTPKYTYKGVDIGNLTAGTTNTTLTNYGGFPSYDSATPYSTERPLPFGITQQGTDVSKKMNATFNEYKTVGPSTYTVPSDYKHIRAVLLGGGGGGGGNGGCGGGPGKDRTPGGSGASGTNGGFTYVSDVLIDSGKSITCVVGDGGGLGSDGGAQNNQGQSGGDGGQGIESYISFTSGGVNCTVYAKGGDGGDGGTGGTNNHSSSGPGGVQAASNTANTYNGITVVDGNAPGYTISSNINPLGYITNLSQGGGGSSSGGQAGYVRIYLLRGE
uniref:Uncharacterized protein n=1 Tax=viral metagenome TaxID=1070528 RepID=A0A6C0B7R7_9ZZZZ